MTGRTKEETNGVTLLGNQHTQYPNDYDPKVLETFVNKHPDHDYFVKFNCPEFTSLCPITGQPDFATLYISYVPDGVEVLAVVQDRIVAVRYGKQMALAFHPELDEDHRVHEEFLRMCGEK